MTTTSSPWLDDGDLRLYHGDVLDVLRGLPAGADGWYLRSDIIWSKPNPMPESIDSGTTALVARKHGRRSIGIDLSVDYLAIAARRTRQLSLLTGSEPT